MLPRRLLVLLVAPPILILVLPLLLQPFLHTSRGHFTWVCDVKVGAVSRAQLTLTASLAAEILVSTDIRTLVHCYIIFQYTTILHSNCQFSSRNISMPDIGTLVHYYIIFQFTTMLYFNCQFKSRIISVSQLLLTHKYNELVLVLATTCCTL